MTAPPNEIDNPKYWRARAEEARTVAACMTIDRTRSVMIGIAESYERLADQAEKRAEVAAK